MSLAVRACVCVCSSCLFVANERFSIITTMQRNIVNDNNSHSSMALDKPSRLCV